MRELKVLNLSKNNISNDSIFSIQELNCKKLKELHIVNTKITLNSKKIKIMLIHLNTNEEIEIITRLYSPIYPCILNTVNEPVLYYDDSPIYNSGSLSPSIYRNESVVSNENESE